MISHHVRTSRVSPIVVGALAVLVLASGGRLATGAERVLGDWECLWLGKTLVQEFGKVDPRGVLTFSPAEGAAICRSMEEGGCSVGVIAELGIQGSAVRPPPEWESMELGRFAVAIIVNGRNPVHHLTFAQLGDVFSGATADWSKLRGAGSPLAIELYAPTLTSTERKTR